MHGDVLVDTSVWIDLFRDTGSSAAEEAEDLLRTGEACVTGLVATELVRGARGRREREVVHELLELTRWLPVADEVYREAGELGHLLARRGVIAATVDLVLAQLAIEQGIPLLSLDRHFAQIAEHSKLQLHEAG